MRFALRSIATILFTILFLFSITASTITFKILDRNFIKDSLVKNEVYQKVPEFIKNSIQKDARIPKSDQVGALEIAKNATPELVQTILETNLNSIFDYLEGKSKTIDAYFPAKKLGLPGNTQEIYTFPQGEIPKTNNPAIEYFKMANGGKSSLILATLGIIFLTLVVFVGHIKLGGQKKTKGSGILLIFCSVLVLLISIAGKFFITKLSKDLQNSAEPSQVLISLLAPPILGDILNLWIIIASVSFVFGFIFLLFAFPKKDGLQ